MKNSPINSTLLASILSLAAIEVKPMPANTFINPANGHQYFLTDVLSWQEAQAVAGANGGNLVTINDAAENTWLVNTFINSQVDFFWIGINDVTVEGKFEWMSGEPVNYTNWALGEPNNNPANGGEDFGTLNGPANPFNRPVGTWSDAPTFAKLRGIVEISVPKPLSSQ
jgi:hypothetical protein